MAKQTNKPKKPLNLQKPNTTFGATSAEAEKRGHGSALIEPEDSSGLTTLVPLKKTLKLKKQPLSLSFDPQLAKLLTEEALKRGESLSSLIEMVILDKLGYESLDAFYKVYPPEK